MTEQKYDDYLLTELLEHPQPASSMMRMEAPILTHSDEQKLLAEANRVGPPTLAPVAADLEPPEPASAVGGTRAMPVSFGAEALDVVRRHPLPVLLFVTGLAYLLLRRKA